MAEGRGECRAQTHGPAACRCSLLQQLLLRVLCCRGCTRCGDDVAAPGVRAKPTGPRFISVLKGIALRSSSNGGGGRRRVEGHAERG